MKIKNILYVIIRQHYPLSVSGHIVMLSPKDSDRYGTEDLFYKISICLRTSDTTLILAHSRYV